MSNAYKKLFYGSTMEVIKICGLLETLDIVPVLKNQAESARLAGFGTLYTDQEVWVHTDEFDKAREVVTEL